MVKRWIREYYINPIHRDWIEKAINDLDIQDGFKLLFPKPEL